MTYTLNLLGKYKNLPLTEDAVLRMNRDWISYGDRLNKRIPR
ncbi:hypothetical protein PN465_11330 [Nodularia spumigena CS-584]|jgi:hypothetical protein|uniref:Uncharacterized protein n=1 Tax=Nodularia spumigena UHCC 0060 TaxID=3110300 RepID=A0ABU5ULK4_NODSP|nr:hypothetical protein [Nodularia spumigena]AHJ30918.1 hypothetical protein NSP_46260 [Nodularia spumigena CCY9414]MDB9382808.1 hypothetical protein [Nodularia spumigena CS-584]MEA5523558.1 hypothetical protein [Nodularia spumigena UHCC 0143]MEA5607133.1 hypothetical protein [Nodularia spumigena UHCC 0060]